MIRLLPQITNCGLSIPQKSGVVSTQEERFGGATVLANKRIQSSHQHTQFPLSVPFPLVVGDAEEWFGLTRPTNGPALRERHSHEWQL